MYIEQLLEAVGHLKAAAIGALLRKLDFTFDGSHYVRIIPYGKVYITPPNNLGEGGGEVISDAWMAKKYIYEYHNPPVQFDNIRGFIDEIFAPFLTLVEPTLLKLQEPISYNGLQNLYIDTSSGGMNRSRMPDSFRSILAHLGGLDGTKESPNDTATSVALDAFRSNFIEDVQRKIENISKEAMLSHTCIMAQYGLIEGVFTDTITVAKKGAEVFYNYRDNSVLEAISTALQIGRLVTRVAAAGVGGMQAMGLTLAEMGLEFLETEVKKEIALGGPTFDECFDSLRQAANSIADELYTMESALANALKSSAEKITTHPIDYDHDPEGKGPGFRDVINLPTGPLAAISEVHLTSIIDDLGEAIPYLQELSLEAGATRGADLGYSTHGAMTECQDLIISISKTLEDLKQDVSDGKFNLDATIAAINNADNLLALQMQEITADLMES